MFKYKTDTQMNFLNIIRDILREEGRDILFFAVIFIITLII